MLDVGLFVYQENGEFFTPLSDDYDISKAFVADEKPNDLTLAEERLLKRVEENNLTLEDESLFTGNDFVDYKVI